MFSLMSMTSRLMKVCVSVCVCQSEGKTLSLSRPDSTICNVHPLSPSPSLLMSMCVNKKCIND